MIACTFVECSRLQGAYLRLLWRSALSVADFRWRVWTRSRTLVSSPCLCYHGISPAPLPWYQVYAISSIDTSVGHTSGYSKRNIGEPEQYTTPRLNGVPCNFASAGLPLTVFVLDDPSLSRGLFIIAAHANNTGSVGHFVMRTIGYPSVQPEKLRGWVDQLQSHDSGTSTIGSRFSFAH